MRQIWNVILIEFFRLCCDKLIVYSNIYPTRCSFTQFIYVWKLLYMFRVAPPPIIRSAWNSIYSIWYLSHRYCYLPLSWKSWNWFECAVDGVRHQQHRYSNFSWWWAHVCPKHVVKRNKYAKQNCASGWIYLQDCTRMHLQQNIEFLPLRNCCSCLTVYFVYVFHLAKFQVLTTALLKIQVLRDVMSYRLVDLYQSFDGF